MSAFDLYRRDTDAIAFDQNLIAGDGLAIHANQIVRFLAFSDSLVEQCLHAGVVFDLDVICEAATVVVDE